MWTYEYNTFVEINVVKSHPILIMDKNEKKILCFFINVLFTRY